MADARTPDEILADKLATLRDKPLDYVMFNFPWDTERSIQVVKLPRHYRERFPGCTYGPDEWACEFLDELGEQIRDRNFNGRQAVTPIRFSTVSGHEIGKSALVAWLTKFIMDTRPMSKGSVTAVTDEQLRTKTWAELGKWHYMSLTEHWFNYTSARGSMTLSHANRKFAGTWRCDARTCREEKSEAFAGQHAPTATSFYIFDEASGVPDKVYEVREGGLTSGEPMVFDFGNGTKNSGQFFENCVGRTKHRSIVRSIDSRDVAITNKEKIAADVADFGEDSDFVRVRWRGLFPAKGNAQFISTEEVLGAMARTDIAAGSHPLVLGVDVARFGDDRTIIYPRKGPDAATFEPKIFSGLDVVQVSDMVGREFSFFEGMNMRPAMIFVDSGGVGGGVHDILASRGYPVMGVEFGSRASDPRSYRYKMDEMWGKMRDYMKRMALPADDTDLGRELKEDLTQREYGVMADGQRISLESKREMKKRGLRSPDLADALALTFAAEMPMLRQDEVNVASEGNNRRDWDYDPFANAFGEE